jgi:hypothetical protein
MLTLTFAFNITFHSCTLALGLLAIVARPFDCDYNIFDLVIGLSIDVPINVVGNINDDLVVSFNVGLKKE